MCEVGLLARMVSEYNLLYDQLRLLSSSPFDTRPAEMHDCDRAELLLVARTSLHVSHFYGLAHLMESEHPSLRPTQGPSMSREPIFHIYRP